MPRGQAKNLVFEAALWYKASSCSVVVGCNPFFSESEVGLVTTNGGCSIVLLTCDGLFSQVLVADPVGGTYPIHRFQPVDVKEGT